MLPRCLCTVLRNDGRPTLRRVLHHDSLICPFVLFFPPPCTPLSVKRKAVWIYVFGDGEGFLFSSGGLCKTVCLCEWLNFFLSPESCCFVHVLKLCVPYLCVCAVLVEWTVECEEVSSLWEFTVLLRVLAMDHLSICKCTCMFLCCKMVQMIWAQLRGAHTCMDRDLPPT